MSLSCGHVWFWCGDFFLFFYLFLFFFIYNLCAFPCVMQLSITREEERFASFPRSFPRLLFLCLSVSVFLPLCVCFCFSVCLFLFLLLFYYLPVSPFLSPLLSCPTLPTFLLLYLIPSLPHSLLPSFSLPPAVRDNSPPLPARPSPSPRPPITRGSASRLPIDRVNLRVERAHYEQGQGCCRSPVKALCLSLHVCARFYVQATWMRTRNHG